MFQKRGVNGTGRRNTGKKSGCVAIRKLWCDDENADWVREALGMPDCRIAFRLDREVWLGKTLLSRDTRYFLTSLDPETTSASDLLRLARGHWQVENCLHWVKDRLLDEDRHSLRRDGLGERLLKIRDMGVSVLNLLKKTGERLCHLAEELHFRPKPLLQILGFAQCEK
jgi:predicted transposase YbfD/YdcC